MYANNDCKFCSYFHKRVSCPAFGKHFKNCKAKDQISTCCPTVSKNITQVERYESHIKVESEDVNESLFIETVSDDDFVPFNSEKKE